MILFLLFTNDVTICMELDPGIHIGSTWFVLEIGCDNSLVYKLSLALSTHTKCVQVCGWAIKHLDGLDMIF
jgi:hypothetical protein